MSDLKTCADRLSGLLEKETSLLKAGNLADAVALASEKSTLLRAFEMSLQEERVSVSVKPLFEKIAAMAGESERHYQAMQNGIRSVISRMEGLDHNSYVGSYNQFGTKMAFTGATGGYLKKL